MKKGSIEETYVAAIRAYKLWTFIAVVSSKVDKGKDDINIDKTNIPRKGHKKYVAIRYPASNGIWNFACVSYCK